MHIMPVLVKSYITHLNQEFVRILETSNFIPFEFYKHILLKYLIATL